MSRALDQLQSLRFRSPSRPHGRIEDYRSLPTPTQVHTQLPDTSRFRQGFGAGLVSDIRGLPEAIGKVAKFNVGYDPEVVESIKRRQALREQGGQEAQLAAEQEAFKDRNIASPFAVAASLTGGLREPGLGKAFGTPARAQADLIQNQLNIAEKGRLYKLGIDPQAIDDPAVLARIQAEAPDIAEKIQPPVTQVTGEGGAVPPREPPAPPIEPPAGPPPEPPLSKLTKAIRGAKKATPEQRAMFAQQRAQRTGAATSTLERGIAQGKGAEAFGQAKGQLAGEFERPQFAVPEFTQADMHSLVQDIGTAEIPFYKKLNAQSALEDLARGRIPEPKQLEALKMAFPQGGDELVKALLSKRSLGEKALAELVSFLGLPQKLKASLDEGTRFRQSLVLGWSHPRQWLSNWKPTTNAMFSEKAAQEVMTKVESNPWFSIQGGERAGLGFDDLGGHTYRWESFTEGPERVEGFQGMNESWLNSATDRIPGIRGSQRSFAVDLNKAGVEVYAQEAEAMWNAGVRDPEMYKAVLRVINHARGYGAFNPGQIGKGVSAFFSGRNLVARFQVALDPLVQPGSLFKPSARQLAAKNLVGMVAGDMAVLGLIGTAGAATGLASVQFNPLKPGADWLKVRIGDTRIDPWGGFIPMARLIARMGAAAATETGLADTQYDTASVKRELLTFFSNKEAPLVRKFTDAVGMSEAYDPSKLLSVKTLVDIYSPFVSQDIWDAVKQQGWGMGAIAGVVSPVGIGVQTYTNPTEQMHRLFEEKYGRPFNPETDYRIAEQDDDFDFLLDRIRRQGMERGQEGAKRIEQAEQSRADTEQELGLPELARQFQEGAENGPAIISRWEDLDSQMAGSYRAIYIGSDPKKKETPDGKTLQKLGELNPNLEPWVDFETGEIDWDGFRTEKERLIESLSPDVQKAYEAFVAKSVDPDLRAIEPQVREARGLHSQSFDYPKYAGITPTEADELDKFVAFVKTEYRRAKLQNPDFPLTQAEAAQVLGRKNGDAKLGSDAALVIQGKAPVNKERINFLLKNQEILGKFYPDLYRSIEIQRQLNPDVLEAVLQ